MADRLTKSKTGYGKAEGVNTDDERYAHTCEPAQCDCTDCKTFEDILAKDEKKDKPGFGGYQNGKKY
jgi:hypothetical protein